MNEIKHKTALERLSWKIAEEVFELIKYRDFNAQDWSTEDIYQIINRNMPLDREEIARECEQWVELDLSTMPRRKPKPSLFGRLRKAVHADDGTSVGVVIEAAIKQIKRNEDEIKRLKNELEYAKHGWIRYE